MKSIGSYSLSFGLVNIPVKVYSAAEEKALSFDMLHKKDLSPIRYARICKEDGEEVPYKDIVKGYEYEKGHYVVVEEEDFQAAGAKKRSTIEIRHFAYLDEIDPIYYEKPYYLEPDKRSGKAYQLLREALLQSKRVAVVDYVFRNRAHMGILLAAEDVLILLQIRYQMEIRSPESLVVPKEKLSEKELEVALQLVDQQTRPFKPEEYHDIYTEELMNVIEQKLQGKKPSKKSVKAPSKTPERDLMHLLKESMKKSLAEVEKSPPKKMTVVPSPKRKTKRK